MLPNRTAKGNDRLFVLMIEKDILSLRPLRFETTE